MRQPRAASVLSSRLLKKTHMPIALSMVEGCAQSPRYNVLAKYASARRFFARLASEIFLSSLQPSFSATCELCCRPNQ